MTDPVELELQLRLIDKDTYKDLLADPVFKKSAKPAKRVEFETTYFDTAEHRLQKNGFAFRIRKSVDGYTATIKNRGTDGGGLFARNEWNAPASSEEPSIDVFGDLPVGKRLAEIVGVEALLPVFKTVVSRTYVLISPEEGSVVELSADTGEVTCQGRSEEICEIELELKKGPAHCIFKIAQELASRYPLLPEENSKYLRGLMLAGLAVAPDSGKKQKSLRFNKNAGYQTISALLLNHLDAVTGAQGNFIRSPLPKTIHQLRISVRTFRSLLYLLKPLCGMEAYRTMQEEFGVFARRFSRIRDLDVLMRSADAFRQKNPDGAVEAGEFIQWMQEKRMEENRLLHQALSAGWATPMLLRAKAFLLRLHEDGGVIKEDRIYSAICSRFKKKLGKFKKDYKNTDFSDPKAVHALRIQCKKLNYSLQFLNADKKEETATEKDLKKLQKVLGQYCDIGNFLRIAGEYREQGQGDALQDFIRQKDAERIKFTKKVMRLQP